MQVNRKRLIIEAAEQSFALFGYKATTMDQVAKAANVGKGTIYTFFANKEELFDEIMLRLIQEMKLAADEEYDVNRNFFDNVNCILHRLLDFQEKHHLAIKMAYEVREMGTPKAVEGLNKLEGAILSYIQVKIQTAIDKNELRPCNPEITAFIMLKLYMALASEWRNSHKPFSKDEITELIQLYIMNGLAVQ